MIHRKKRGNLKPHNSSIVLNLKPVFAARNIMHPTAYLIKIGINSATASKILRGDAVQVNFRQLTTLCLNLNCTPNDLFALRDMQLPESHALQVLHSVTQEDGMMTVNDWLAGKTVEEVRELLRKTE
jgi:DNA-binding Xre family transcriptional regulator